MACQKKTDNCLMNTHKYYMYGIYIHIPFCKQACHYCDFHFSTSLKKKRELVDALCQELILRKDELNGEVQTIYLGGGTPSLLSEDELHQIFDTILSNYKVAANAEITLEANPDDLSEIVINTLSKSPINRLSIGVQSFFEDDLRLMNRAHNAVEAETSILLAKNYFDNLTIDLIYGIPKMSVAKWQANIDKALALGVPHISAYALTVEPNTALETFIAKGKIAPVDEELAAVHFDMLKNTLEQNDFVHYEFSNYGKEGFFSQNNTAYWRGRSYLGIGPSAHSYNGKTRSWNIANNTLYIKAIQQGKVPIEIEELSVVDRYNEYVMTGLRTMWGVSLDTIEKEYGEMYKEYLLQQAQKYISAQLLVEKEGVLTVTTKGKFLTDGLASDLFFV